MGMTQTQKVEEDPGVLVPNNPFVPPKGDDCFINDLPPELLSHIFEVGSADDSTEEDGTVSYWDILHHQLSLQGNDEKSPLDSDVGMKDEVVDEDEEDEDDDDEGDSDTTGSSDFPSPWPTFSVVVSHVCRHWRNVALSTPSLWTTIEVTPGARPPYEHASTLLERSKSLPIDININCEPDEDSDVGPHDAAFAPLLSMFISHIHRWRTMEVSVSEYHLMYLFLIAVSSPSIPAAPQLTTLELYHHEEAEDFISFGYPNMSEHLTLFGGSAPLLTRVVLWGVHIDWSQPWIASAPNLTDLELAYHAEDVRPSWAQFVTILRSASALEKLGLRQSGPSGDPPVWFIEPTLGGPADLNAPIQLLRVIDLTLAFHPQARVIGLLRKFYLPALKNLVLDFDFGDYTSFVHELTGPATSLYPGQEEPRSLLRRLESLKIAGLPCAPPCVRSFYGELQNLSTLNISLSYLPHIFLDILSTPCKLPGRGNIWLPRLATLYVSGTFGTALRHLVQERRNAGVALSSLYVEESCELEDEDVEWLRQNVETFDFFEGSDDEDDVIDMEDLNEDDVVDFEDLSDEVDEWSDMD